MNGKYDVHYSFYLSESVEIEAGSREEACDKCRQMIINGELGNLNEMEICDQEIWVD